MTDPIEPQSPGNGAEKAVNDLSHPSEGEGTGEPNDAPDMSVEELHLAKLNAAVAAGYTGRNAVTFAGLLNGQTTEEITRQAAELVEMFNGTTRADDPVDPSQGRGGTADHTSTFADILREL